MTSDPFDAKLLFERKVHHGGYRYCPWCRTELVETTLDHHVRLICAAKECGFVYYQNPVPAAGAIIVENDSLLLVRRAHEPQKGLWCLPAGFMEWTEHPSQTAIREVREETGLEIKLDSLFDIYSGDDDPRTNAILVLYLASVVGGKMQASDDALEVAYFPFDSLPEPLAFHAHRQAVIDYNSRVRRSNR